MLLVHLGVPYTFMMIYVNYLFKKKKAFFSNTLIHWMAAYDCFHISSFYKFFVLFLFLVRCFSCILPMCLGAPLVFIEFRLLI
jgi:hypothetical protein